MSAEQRPAAYVSGILITPRMAYLLETRGQLSQLRTSIRGDHEELDELLRGIRWAAMSWANSVNVTPPRKGTEAAVDWYTPGRIAAAMHVTEHAIRLAIREGRLPATKHDGRWQISPADYQTYKTRSTR